MIKKIFKFISKYSKFIIIFVLFLTILGATQIRNLKVEDDITKYISENDPEIQFYQSISETFGKYDENLTLIAIEYENIFQLNHLKNFKQIAEQLEKSEYINSVNSFLNLPKISSTDFGIEVRKFVETFPETQQEAQALKKSAIEDDLVNGAYLSPDGQVGLLMVESMGGIDGNLLMDNFKDIINKYSQDVRRVEYFGLPIMDAQISEMAFNNMLLAIIAAIIILILLNYCFKSIQGTVFPIFVAILSSFWMLSAVASSGKTVTIVISVIPVIMLSLVTAYGIHFISRYYEERHFYSPKEAVEKAIQFAFIPILMSALTTMAGFASLITAVVRPMTEFGIFATMGIFVAFMLVIFLLGAIFSAFPPQKVPKNFSYDANDLITRFLRIIARSIIKKRKIVMGIIVIIIIISGIFASQVEPDSSIEARLGKDNPITLTMDYFKEKFGGVDFLYVYFETDNVKHPYILRSIDKIQNYAQRLPSLAQPSSITTFLTQLNNAMENKAIIPANPDKINNLWFFAEDNEYINAMIAKEDQRTILQVRSREMASLVLDRSIKKVDQFVAKIPNPVKEIQLSQLPPSQKERYYPYLAQDIISSWQALGTINDNIPDLKAQLIQIASKPVDEFIQVTSAFADQVIELSSLEIEDFGLSTEEVRPIVLDYLKDDLDQSFLVNILMEELAISRDDANYLKEVFNTSLEILTERQKIQYAQAKIEEMLDKSLVPEEADYLWYLTDDYVYVPDPKGDIQFSYRLTGIPVITNQVNESVYQGQIKSMFTAFIAVFILLALQFGSILIGLAAMVPIVLTILTAFGLMGIAHIKLNIGTMMVASIAIGAGIDYTIHYINRYKQELKRHDRIKAMKVTLTGTGRAIVFNSISVAAGLFVLAFSEINMIAVFGELIGSVMLLSVIYTLLLLPLLLKYIHFKEEKKE